MMFYWIISKKLYLCTMDRIKRDSKDLKIEITADGSATLYVESLDEHYHSVRGALAESNHIYRDCAFLHRTKQSFTPPLRLLEIGFGTGLNAVVTAMCVSDNNPVHYISIEKYPIDRSLLNSLDYSKFIDSSLFEDIHAAKWNQIVNLTDTFSLEKIQADFLETDLPQNIDVVYFDAFAPEKQPEMWSKEMLEKIYNIMNIGGILTTYCAKGEIRRMLKSIGFHVERISGPIGGKREILRATKIE